MPISLDRIKQLGQSLQQKTQAPVGAAQPVLDRLKPYLVPAALGAAAGGPLMAYFAGKNHIEGEAPRVRRHRIMRNALLGLTLGGVAGGGIPAGADTLLNSARPMSGFHPVDAAANSAVHHWAPTAAGGAGGMFALHRLGKNRDEAANAIHEAIGYERAPAGANYRQPLNPVITKDRLMMDAMNPVKQPEVIAGLAGANGGNKWQARELLGEAGVHNMPPIREGGARAGDMMRELHSHLSGQGPVSRLVSKLVPTESSAIESAVAKPWSPYRAAELYSKYIRPSIGNSVLKTDGLHFGAPYLAAGVGAGMLGANYLQNKLEGN